MKILIICQYSFFQNNATSITLKNLFSGFCNDDICFLYPSLSETDKNIDFGGYRKIFAKSKYFYNIGKKKISNTISKERSEVSGIYKKNSMSLKSFVFNWIHVTINAYRSIFPYYLDNETISSVKEFNPDVIYTLGGAVNINNLAFHLSSKLKIPVVTHFMDDWLNTTFSDSVILYPAKLFLKYSLKRLLRQSKVGLAISDYMAKEYESKFGIEMHALMNVVSTEIGQLNKNSTNQHIKTVVYAGGLHLNRTESIVYFCKSLIKANVDLEFNIYTSEQNWKANEYLFKDYSFIRYCGYLSSEDIMKKIVGADFLLHVESFDSSIEKYTRLSISTKIPEYLSSGNPIIAIGPASIASIRYLEDNDAAFVISDIHDSNGYKALAHFINSKDVHNNCASNAKKLYNKNHIKEKQQQVLKSVLLSAIKTFSK